MAFVSDLPHTTLVYKTTDAGLDVHIDVWAPKSALHDNADGGSGSQKKYPALVYFHGGGFAVGARDVWIPPWLFNRLTDQGYMFISADYRLVPPGTVYDIAEDVKDLWAFITRDGFRVSFDTANSDSTERSRIVELDIDRDKIVVAGSSAGGMVAYLAAMHCRNPRPNALLEIYGVGGQIFSSYYISSKKDAFKVHSFEYLHKADFQDYIYPYPRGRPDALANSYPDYAIDHPLGPSYPANPRMQLVWLYLQHGELLDYLTGAHEPSLSEELRTVLALQGKAGTECEDVGSAIEDDASGRWQKAVDVLDRRGVKELFPQFNVDAGQWPPTVFLHGTGDTGVPVGDSRYIHGLLRAKGVQTENYEAEGQEHAFDYAEDAEDRWNGIFDAIVDFVVRRRVVKDSMSL